MANKILTNNYKLFISKYLTDISDKPLSNGLYVFAGKPIPNINDSIIDSPTNSNEDRVAVYRDMIFGKKITKQDIKNMIPRYDWALNTVYVRYDDSDPDLQQKKFFVVVRESDLWHVFICIDNANNSPSQVPPTFSDTSPEDTFYQTSDGYQWKYLYTIQKSDFDKFATGNFIPVIPNLEVAAAAVPGAINLIYVKNGGGLYNNYISGQFNATDIKINGNTTRYRISDKAATQNGFYSNCMIVISDGTGKGQYKNIVQYTVAGNSKEIIISSPFEIIPDQSSRYEISPRIILSGNGSERITCAARALINAYSSNSIYGVEIVERGEGYTFATANVAINNNIVPSIDATFKVIVPPHGGHGYDINQELGAYRIGISTMFANSENGSITTSNDFRRIGLLYNPLYSKINIQYDQVPNPDDLITVQNTRFFNSELVYQFTPQYQMGQVNISTNTPNVYGTNTTFTTWADSNTYVYITDDSFSMFSKISNVTNNTVMTLTSNGNYDSLTSNSVISIAKLSAVGKISEISTNAISLTNVAGKFNTSGFIVGANSMSVAKITDVSLKDNPTNFNTFQQLIRLDGIATQGTFIKDEIVEIVGSPNSTAYFHSSEQIGGTAVIYITKKSGIFSPSSVVKGTVSNALFTINKYYDGDLIEDSGDIFYVENFEPIARANNQSEVIKIVVEF